MEKYLIEVPHKADKDACINAVKIFYETGSHFLTNADWGCYDGEHKAWFTVEVNSKDEALRILPSAFKSKAKIVKLNRFDWTDIEGLLSNHSE